MKLAVLLVGLLLISFSGYSQDDADHGHDDHQPEGHEEGGHKEEGQEEHHDEHGEDKGHDDHEGEEESSAIGPEKGITKKGALGFQLAPEAEASFGLKFQPIGSATVMLPRTALVQVQNNDFVFRERGGWLKKIPVATVGRTNDSVKVRISDFTPGDRIVTAGTGFLRTAELVVEEGVSHGHSH